MGVYISTITVNSIDG